MDGIREIVVVEDNGVLLNLMTEILRQRGYSVRTASDGFSALALLRDAVPDVLLSDLNMPGMSGFELLSVVRRRFPSITAIAMSGAYSEMSFPHGIAADGFYPKGSGGIRELLEILRKMNNDKLRNSTRASAPVWIPALPSR